MGEEEVEEKGQRKRKREESVVDGEEDISWLASPKCWALSLGDPDVPCFFESRAAFQVLPWLSPTPDPTSPSPGAHCSSR